MLIENIIYVEFRKLTKLIVLTRTDHPRELLLNNYLTNY